MTSRSRRRCRAILLLIAALACAEWPLADISGQERSGEPSARLIPAPSTVLPGQADSNSPVLWELVSGRSQMFLLTSVNGRATRHTGPLLSRLTSTGDVAFVEHPGHGVWFEAIVRDEDGTWYGFYHNEWPDVVCDNDTRVIPKIGAARSRDFGTTWENLGIILEAPPNSHDCASTNKYFVGGVGDFSVALDATRQYLYLFFSQYGRREMSQGVSVARMAWADRDAPAGKLAVWWRKQVWLPTRVVASDEGERFVYPAGAPVYAVADGWHDDASVDAFWGPSVHWNTYLQQYVMLLNRAVDPAWRQEGVYVSFLRALDDPASWSAPERLIAGGRWYPQVVGIEADTGTDKSAGEVARFFMAGRSEYFIAFSR